MLVRLKHIKSAKKTLSDGSTKTYYYHRQTGKPIEGKPGTKEFVESYHIASQHDATLELEGTLKLLIGEYLTSPEFDNLAGRTKKDYRKQLAKIENRFGLMPVEVLNDRRIRKDFMDWRTEIAKHSLRQADYMWTVMRLLAKWAYNRGELNFNHFSDPGQLYNVKRTDKIWMPEDVEAFNRYAEPHMQLVMLLALHTGQRQGDLLALTWSAFDGTSIQLRQSKTGRHVHIPCTVVLKDALDNLPRIQNTILTTKTGKSWRENNLRNRWREVTSKAKIKGITFNDLRGTTVTILSEQGCTIQEIAAITGHSLKTAQAILDTYSSRTRALSQNAIIKLESSWIGQMDPIENIAARKK